ncbi:TLR adapter interacting with SLC15A4 on the lysosome-like [Narcine bancroftii]|uniref:TLR adapter interacting with SLC15A4 on the lysosome-like n=1 Tax=Narcine bancroftii TaxID=1343680 RepID=UPI0038322EDC
MLSEGFICGIPYWNEYPREDRSEQREPSPLYDDMGHELNSVENFLHCPHSDSSSVALSLLEKCKSFGSSFRSSEREKKATPLLQAAKVTLIAKQKSLVVDIPGSSGVSKETYFVPSCCKSICDNYNDLQIAGDHVLPIDSGTSGLISQSSLEDNMGPFLYSLEIPSPESPKLSEFPNKLRNSDTSCWCESSAKYKSIIQHSQPLTNSVLNDYLEQKVMELYKQYIMDSMVSSASPTKIIESEFIMNNVDQISMQISREQNMETTKAKDIVISCLLRLASEIQSNELSTPNLQISS